MKIDKASEIPVYEQVIQNMISLILNGSLKPGGRVPSVRKTADQLGVNPNTIQKSYKMLLEDGVLYSVKGKGNFVAEDLSAFQYMKKQKVLEAIKRLTKEAKEAGLWIDELLTAVDAAYSDI